MIYYLESVEFYRRFWDDFCQLILCILWIDLRKGHRYELRPLFLYNHSSKNDSWTQFDLFLGNCYKRFWNDISQLILWIYRRGGHRYELRPAIPFKPSEQKWWIVCGLLLESVDLYIRFWNDISQLILWIYLRKGHRKGFRPPVSCPTLWTKMAQTIWIIPLKLLRFFMVLKWYIPTHSMDLSLQEP